MHTVSANTMIQADPEVVACELGSGSALLSLRSSMYYSLNEVGAFVWQKLSQPTSIDELCEAVGGSFAVEPERCREDVLALIGEMEQAGLVDAMPSAHV